MYIQTSRKHVKVAHSHDVPVARTNRTCKAFCRCNNNRCTTMPTA